MMRLEIFPCHDSMQQKNQDLIYQDDGVQSKWNKLRCAHQLSRVEREEVDSYQMLYMTDHVNIFRDIFLLGSEISQLFCTLSKLSQVEGPHLV